MSRVSHFVLKNGAGSGWGISYIDETDDEVIASYLNRWGDEIETITINGRVVLGNAT